MNQRFLHEVAKFFVFFGAFWIIFTAVVAFFVELRPLLAQGSYPKVLPYFISILYVGRVFFFFIRDLRQKTKNPSFNMLGQPLWFGFDVVFGLGLLMYELSTLLANPHIYTTIVFNNLSAAFFSLQFLFFRFVFTKIGSIHAR